jgi:uncharacterized membrane protein HdeD (DUF308 family)
VSIPFSRADFFEVFARYNETMWPAQVVLYVLAIVGVASAVRHSKDSGRGAFAVLAILWLWMGLFYHAAFFASINRVARLFAVAFVAQGLIFAGLSAKRDAEPISPQNNFEGWAGGALIFVGLVGYPVLSVLAGHLYPYQPTIGLPCPTTIFTLGLLIWGWESVPKYALVIPMFWAFIGTTAAFQLGVPEDLLLALSAIVVGIAAHMRRPAEQAMPVGPQRTS